MPKNTKGGKNFKKGKKATFEPTVVKYVPEPNEDNGQSYARVIKLLGNRRVLVKLFDEYATEMNCNIPKSFKRERMYVNNGDLLIIGTRPDLSNDNKGDVHYLYSQQEEERLVKRKLVPARDVSFEEEEDNVNAFTFEMEDDSEEVDLADL